MPELLAGSHHPGVLAVDPSVLEEHPSCPSPREVETSCPHQALPRWSDGETLSYRFLEWLGSKTVDNWDRETCAGVHPTRMWWKADLNLTLWFPADLRVNSPIFATWWGQHQANLYAWESVEHKPGLLDDVNATIKTQVPFWSVNTLSFTHLGN